MAYTINLTNGSTLTTIADGTVNDTSTPLVLVGKNYAGYGQFLNTDMVHLLENFNDSTEPTNKLTGQLWWDSAGNLKVYSGSAWKTLNSITSSAASPSGAVTGNSWFDTVNNALYIYDGAVWQFIGPTYSANSGVETQTIDDSLGGQHDVLNVNVDGVRIAIISSAEDEFTPSPLITGYTTINPGFNLTDTVANVSFWGNASNALQLGGRDADVYARTDTNETFNGTITVNNNSGLTVGTSNNFGVTVSGSTVQLTNNTNNANITVRTNTASVLTTAMTVVGSTAGVNFANVVTVSGNLEAYGYVNARDAEDATSNTTGAVRITGGMSVQKTVRVVGDVYAANLNAAYFNGVAVGALYSDLAERYLADAIYDPGTVLVLGGDQEVTICNEENSTDVFGVVSTEPAYLMNSLNGSAELRPAPPVAMVGRVPVKVIGPVSKNQRLVSAGNGLAKGLIGEVNPLAVIGRSLETKVSESEGVVEAVVRINI